jgi:hypothetical protein
MKVLDLFAGTGSATQAFEDRGHEVYRVELDERFPADHRDILTYWPEPGSFDVVWASPPCTAFSMAGSGSKKNGSTRWIYRDKNDPHPYFGPRVPNDDVAHMGCRLVAAALARIYEIKPKYWWLENPMGGLRTMGFMQRVPGPVTVTYCQYGETRMKPTDLWGVWPDTWRPRPKCKNGAPCHQAAPRGSKTGTQALSVTDRARVPHALSLEICKAVEEALKA